MSAEPAVDLSYLTNRSLLSFRDERIFDNFCSYESDASFTVGDRTVSVKIVHQHHAKEVKTFVTFDGAEEPQFEYHYIIQPPPLFRGGPRSTFFLYTAYDLLENQNQENPYRELFHRTSLSIVRRIVFQAKQLHLLQPDGLVVIDETPLNEGVQATVDGFLQTKSAVTAVVTQKNHVRWADEAVVEPETVVTGDIALDQFKEGVATYMNEMLGKPTGYYEPQIAHLQSEQAVIDYSNMTLSMAAQSPITTQPQNDDDYWPAPSPPHHLQPPPIQPVGVIDLKGDSSESSHLNYSNVVSETSSSSSSSSESVEPVVQQIRASTRDRRPPATVEGMVHWSEVDTRLLYQRLKS